MPASRMDTHEAIRTRRTIDQFTPRPVARETIEQLIETATHAPNHRMTQSWRFYVLAAEARRSAAEVTTWVA